eukprot:5652246-Alexandrium_andersonii.AAC.1
MQPYSRSIRHRPLLLLGMLPASEYSAAAATQQASSGGPQPVVNWFLVSGYRDRRPFLPVPPQAACRPE